jgi:hypothetical protein
MTGHSDQVDPGEASRAEELDGARIKQLAALRRATYRSRSYAMVAAVACAVTVGQVAWMIVRQIRGRIIDGWLAIYLLILLAAGYGLWAFARRIGALNEELKRTRAANEPRAVPDFSTLNDGSQQWKNLEDVH